MGTFDPLGDVRPITSREFFIRSREVFNDVVRSGQRFVITRMGTPAVLIAPAPKELRFTPAAREERAREAAETTTDRPEPTPLDRIERNVLRAVAGRELHAFTNRQDRETFIAVRRALGHLEMEGLLHRTPVGTYFLTDAGRAALAAARVDAEER